MPTIRSALLGLADVDGVLGGFVIDSSGQLIDTNLPSAFDAGVFDEAGPRIVRLVEASAALASGLKSCVLRFAEHKLFVRELNGAFLGVLLGLHASVPALKVAANLVARRIEPLLVLPRTAGTMPSLQAPDVEIHAPDTHRSFGGPVSGPVSGQRISSPPPLPSSQPRPHVEHVGPLSGAAAKAEVLYRGRKLT